MTVEGRGPTTKSAETVVAPREGVSFAERTTLGLGGPARWWVEVRSASEAVAAVEWARSRAAPVLIVGGGSNLVVADAGFDGLVIEVVSADVEMEREEGEVLLRVGAGADWDALVERAVADGLAGIECLSGIPGRVGAAPIQNVGAYGQEVAEVLEAVEVLDLGPDPDRDSGAGGGPPVRRFATSECAFGYRTSRFKHAEAGRWLVLSVELRLRRSATGIARYPELQRRLGLGGAASSAPLDQLRSAVLELRRTKSMVLDPEDPESRSAGSFFVNPIVSADQAVRVREDLGRGLPSWPTAGGRVKLSAAWLIEAAGFRKGEADAGVGISKRHSLALVHRGGGTARALVERAAAIRERVRHVSGVTLEPEPVFVGFGSPRSGRRGLGPSGSEVLDHIVGGTTG